MDFNDNDYERFMTKVLLRDEILKRTEELLQYIVITEYGLARIGDKLIKSCGASHANLLEFHSQTQDFRLRVSWGKRRLPPQLVKADMNSLPVRSETHICGKGRGID